MVDSRLWDTDPQQRDEAGWKALLDGLITSLADFLGRPVTLVDHWIEHVPAYRCHSVTSKVEIELCPGLALKAVGSVSITVEVGERVLVCSDLMLFSDDVRLGEHRKGRGDGRADIVYLTYDRCGDDGTAAWNHVGLVEDENHEWTAMQRADDLTSIYRRPGE